ncbi:L-threonylcarbamoyladenylate synthase [Lentilitoribacter sp. EG35]|uniref:L-threonylcarbamoyladenylate synthase n=1 Tax=Lentilitoribacter sp. EG35 TaxID=3234192 RepID=UPI00345F3F4C
MARILSLTDNKNSALQKAIELLQRGKPIAMPTETVYGLAADATNPEAITSIYETKGRPQFNPLICHMSDLIMAKRYAEFDALSLKLAKTFWPGALTIILTLKADSGIHKLATAGLDTVGIRVPKGSASKLIAKFGKPLAAPSANSSGKISPTTAQHVQDDLGQKIELILDQGACELGVESTIIKVMGDDVYLLRPGGISATDIENVVGKPLMRLDENVDIEAPGMLQSHYAPNAKMRLNVNAVSPEDVLITFGDVKIIDADVARAQFNLSTSGNLKEAAHNLFDMMIMADKVEADMIAVAPIPNDGLGEAINDRLKRAAAPRD